MSFEADNFILQDSSVIYVLESCGSSLDEDTASVVSESR